MNAPILLGPEKNCLVWQFICSERTFPFRVPSTLIDPRLRPYRVDQSLMSVVG